MDFDEDNFDEINGLDEEELFELLDQINYDEDNKKANSIDETNYCTICDTSNNVMEDREKGIMVCIGCGSVISSILDSNPEWSQYEDNDKSSLGRCSFQTNTFLPQSSLGTSIACNWNSKIKTLHGWSAMPYKERSLYIVLTDIQNRCRKADILKCIEDDAKILYKNISECKHQKGKNKGKNIIIRGKNRKSLIAACVFYACKRKGNTRSPKEIANIFDLKYIDITKGCKTFLKLMKICKMSYDFNSSTPEHFVPRFCRNLHIKKEYLDQTIQIAKNIQKLNIASVHTPLSVATGSILLMVDINDLAITKKSIASSFNVSEVTITKAFRKLELYKQILVSDELTDKLSKIMEEENKNIKMPNHLKDRYDNIMNKERK